MKQKLVLYFTIIIFLFISCNESSKTTDDKNEPTIIQKNIEILKNISQSDSLLYFTKQQDEQLQLLHSDSLLAEFRKEVGYIFYQRANFNIAKDYFIKSEESYRKANMPLQANQMLANRAVINDVTGNYKEAITIYLKVVDYFKEQDDSISWASALGNIGAVYEEMGMADKAIYYDKLSLDINLVMHDTLRAATKYNNIGVAFSELKNIPDSAVYYYTKAYKIYKNKGHALYSALVGNNLAMQHIMLNEFTLAKSYLEKAEPVFDSLGNLDEKATTLRYYGELYLAQGDKQKAVDCFEKAIDIYKNLDSKKSLMETGILLSNVYISTESYAKAAQMMQYANTLKDSLMNVDNKKIIADMESKYQLNEKNSTIEILQLKEVLSKKQLKIQLVIIGLLIIVFTLLVLTYYFSIQKNKLKEKELRLELQNYILRIDKLQIEVDEKGNESKTTEEKLKQFELSDRETEVLKFIAQGYKNSEIAEKLFVSQNTIKTHIKNIYVKLDVRNRVEALKRVDIV
jgi:ATP/maltotriose-dependent transcriptional regulator MalT